MSSTPIRVQTAPSLGEALKGSPELHKALSDAFARGDVAVIGPAEFGLHASNEAKPRTPGFR